MQPKDILPKHLSMKAKGKLNMKNVSTTLPVVLVGNSLEAARATFPLFGGTAPDTTSKTESSSSGSSTPSSSTPSSSTTEPADSGHTEPELNPEQIADLLKQVSELTNTAKQLQTENAKYKQKEQESERAKMGREQALQADLEQAQETIVKMDSALKTQAVINAINSYKDVEFYDPKFVLAQLDPAIFENMQVDLESGTVTVTGIENDLKRIAREKSWAVKSNAAGQQQPQSTRQVRGSGSPPPPPSGSNDKASRRAALIDKFPVIAHGRV